MYSVIEPIFYEIKIRHVYPVEGVFFLNTQPQHAANYCIGGYLAAC